MVFVGALALSVVSHIKPGNHPTPAPQSATASGGSVIIQAGGNVTYINAGVPEETEKKRMRELSANLEEKLIEKYPFGYALLGVANGKIVYEPYGTEFPLSGDWDNWRIIIKEEEKPTITLIISKLRVGGMRFEDESLTWSYAESSIAPLPNFVMSARGKGVSIFFELIDAKEKILVMGLSDKRVDSYR
jgi:hypothetical protein